LQWKFRPVDTARRIVGDSRVISTWPIRAGIVLSDGVLYFCCGLFPSQGTYICAVDARSGKGLWKNNTSISPQGYMLLDKYGLYVPTGRTAPVVFDKSTGKQKGKVGKVGGSFAVVGNDYLIHGASEKGQVQINAAGTLESITSMDGLRVIVKENMVYVLGKNFLSALDRDEYIRVSKKMEVILAVKEKQRSDTQKQTLQVLSEERKKAYKWRVSCDCPYSLIMAGDALIAGGDSHLTVFDCTDGSEMYRQEFSGKAYSLAVSDGQMFVSTDNGVIHCFSNSTSANGIRIHSSEVRGLQSLEDAAATAGMITEISDINKGYCLLLDASDEVLIHALLSSTDLHIIALGREEGQIDAVRQRLLDAGVYGSRVTIHKWDGMRLDYQDYLFNLIISSGKSGSGYLADIYKQLASLLTPSGGEIMMAVDDKDVEGLAGIDGEISLSTVVRGGVKWLVGKRGKLAGAGSWTHLYADPGNTSCSGDKRMSDSVQLAWFGDPGPRDIIDRHHRSMSPLYHDGRVFIYGNNVIFCVDAYNGTLYWRREVAASRRLGMMNDSGNMCVIGQSLYIAVKDKCHVIDVMSGELRQKIAVPPIRGIKDNYWGYITVTGSQIIGSGQRPEASFVKLGFGGLTINQMEGDFKPKTTSLEIFSCDRSTGKLLWKYGEGIIMNAAIATGDSAVYFIECRNPEFTSIKTGRVSADQFCKKDTYLVALEINSGKKLWEKKVPLKYAHMMFLSYADGRILLCGSYNQQKKVVYELAAFASADGAAIWKKPLLTTANSGGCHGEQWQHPAIIDGKVYLAPRRTGTLFVLDMATGEMKSSPRPKWKGCGTISASAGRLFYRNSNPQMHDLATDTQHWITRVTRPGCWINIIPAGGMVLIPEGSSGCTCGYSMQSSIAFIPD
jgi:outer membrane protein assembly factor BamB